MANHHVGEVCSLPLGTRDAYHVPFVIAQFDYQKCKKVFEISPGQFVKFTNEECTSFVPCDKKDADGILNPFLDQISLYDNVTVWIMPDITTPVRHHFEIDRTLKQVKMSELEIELQEAKDADPGCADCYEIVNGKVIR